MIITFIDLIFCSSDCYNVRVSRVTGGEFNVNLVVTHDLPDGTTTTANQTGVDAMIDIHIKTNLILLKIITIRFLELR